MTQDVIAVAEAAFEGGFDEVIAADSHGNAHNIDPDLVPDNVQLVRSWPRPLLTMQGLEDPDVEACVFIGYHAGSDAQGVLAHSFYGAACRALRLNGQPCSEGYLSAALAGEHSLPVILVSGDEATIADARHYAPEAEYLITKRAIGWRSAMALPPHQMSAALKRACRSAFNRPRSAPFVLKAPYRLELEMTTQVAAEMLAYLPNVERTGAYTASITLDRVEAVMRFVSFVMLYTPTGVMPF